MQVQLNFVDKRGPWSSLTKGPSYMANGLRSETHAATKTDYDWDAINVCASI